jgi:hypothetical protein
MYELYPIVYGGTFEVDFRMIAMPEVFTEADKNWALKFIAGTTRSAKQLRNDPRWSLFKNERYCIFGITCMAEELIPNPLDSLLGDVTKDFKGRPMYLFAGYVTEIGQGQNLPAIPKYSGNNLELFQDLYEYIKEKWLVKAYQQEMTAPILCPSQSITYSTYPTSDNYDKEYFSLNRSNEQIVRLWTEEDREGLWYAATQQADQFLAQPMSLCLGITTEGDVLASPFLNATTKEVRQREDVSKPLPLERVNPPVVSRENYHETYQDNPSSPQSRQRNENLPNQSPQPLVEYEEIVGGAAGGVAGGVVGASIGLMGGIFTLITIPGGILIGAVVGSGLGFVGAGVITHKGVGGKIAQQIFETENHENSNPSKRKTRGEQSSSSIEDFGLKKKTDNSKQNEDWF